MSPIAGSTSPVLSPSSMPLHHPPHHHHYQQITTITVNKDDRGYGMKVSGDNPVYVQSVKEGKSQTSLKKRFFLDLNWYDSSLRLSVTI